MLPKKSEELFFISTVRPNSNVLTSEEIEKAAFAFECGKKTVWNAVFPQTMTSQ